MIVCLPEDMHPDNCGGDCSHCRNEHDNCYLCSFWEDLDRDLDKATTDE